MADTIPLPIQPGDHVSEFGTNRRLGEVTAVNGHWLHIRANSHNRTIERHRNTVWPHFRPVAKADDGPRIYEYETREEIES